MIERYAFRADLGAKWAALTGDAAADVDSALQEAALIVATALRADGQDPEAKDEDLLKMVVCRMVRRAFPADDPGLPPGLESSQVSLGSFQQTMRWGGGRSGELLLYREEKRMLGIAPRAFSIDMMQQVAQ